MTVPIPNHAAPTRLYPTARPEQGPPYPAAVDAAFTDYLPAAGYPDISEAGLKFAAAQRASARATENRVAATVGPPAQGTVPGPSAQDN